MVALQYGTMSMVGGRGEPRPRHDEKRYSAIKDEEPPLPGDYFSIPPVALAVAVAVHIDWCLYFLVAFLVFALVWCVMLLFVLVRVVSCNFVIACGLCENFLFMLSCCDYSSVKDTQVKYKKMTKPN